MNFIKTHIQGVYIIQPKIWEDERGYFYEIYHQQRFRDVGIRADFLQDNQSLSHKGTLRGLHAQKEPFAQGKLVRVIQGKVWDVAVDIRRNSATFGQYVGVELSGENHQLFWIPPGFLHGFITLVDHTIFTYKVTNFYDSASEIGVLWSDSDLQIHWVLPQKEIILSEKDSCLPELKNMHHLF